MTRYVNALPMILLLVGATTPLQAQSKKSTEVWTDPADPSLPVDFKIQGEYKGVDARGDKLGCQVIALGNGIFPGGPTPGGLPGDGWDGKNKILLAGKLDGDQAVFTPAEGKRKYLARSADEFSATSKFPPVGQKDAKATIRDGVLNGESTTSKSFNCSESNAKPDLGVKPPEDAVVLFDGIEHERMDERPTRRENRPPQHRRRRHPHQAEVQQLHDAHRVHAPLSPRGPRPGTRQQRLLSGRPLRSADPRLVRPRRQEQRMRRRLHQGRAEAQHVPAAAGLADLRRRVHQRRRRGRQEGRRTPA